jgi:hypothetical protein
MTNNDLEYQGLARVTTPWRDRGKYYVLPDDPVAALNILREAAGLDLLPDDDNLPPDHDGLGW